MSTYSDLYIDLGLLEYAGLTSIGRIKYFLEIMRVGICAPIDEKPERHGSVSYYCRALSLPGQPHKIMVREIKLGCEAGGHTVYVPSMVGHKLYSDLCPELEKFILSVDAAGIRTLEEAYRYAASARVGDNTANTYERHHPPAIAPAIEPAIEPDGTYRRTVRIVSGNCIQGPAALKYGGHSLG